MPTASYPNFAGKHAGQAMFTAADFIAYMRQAGLLGLYQAAVSALMATPGS